ncbi:hypothetical protein GCM10009547_36220 [Sporichthya brevicatena]|uniref:Transcriptional regulator n=1 Tax=Sporichthya brevicatena TaxID=171442 RepID=A0ABN1H5C6_9ACTN
MADEDEVARLRRQLSDLHGLFVLGMLMTETRDADEIVALALGSAPALGPCSSVEAQLEAGSEDEVARPATAWSAAYPLHGPGGLRGHLVVGADAPPPAEAEFLWRVLAHQTGTSLANAELHQQALAEAAAADAAKERLAATVSDLERTVEIHEALARVSAAGGGEAGIAAAVAELTGRGVAVEDRFGNLRAWAGPGRPDPYPKPDRRARAELIRRAQAEGRPLRADGRLLALAQPRDDVLGVLVLADPDGDAGPLDTVALQHGAVVLAMELAHVRTLAETELRLRRDLVSDLTTGTDAAGAHLRAQALGHDLHQPHQVLAIGGAETDELADAVDAAVTRLGLTALTGRRSDTVLLLAAAPVPTADLLAAVGDRLARAVAIGVGRVCSAPADYPDSCREALLALDVRLNSADPHGATTYADLGIFRLLAAGGPNPELDAFVQQWLGALLEYDARHRSDLVRTLIEYLERGGNYDETAQAVAVHRSTLRYRLQRIREISGYDLADVDSRFNLHVATRAWRILQGAPR